MPSPASRPVPAPDAAVAAPDATAPPPLSVLLVEDYLSDDGATRANVRLAHRWQSDGVPVRFFATVPPSAELGARFPPDLQITYPLWRPPGLRWVLFVARLVAVARACDVVVAGREIRLGTVLAALAARLARRPFAVIVRSDVRQAVEDYVPPRQRWLVRRALAGADLLICLSPGLLPGVRELGVPEERATVVFDGIDVGQVLAGAAREPEPGVVPAGEEPLVVASGRLTRQKGFDVLIRAVARLRERGRRVRLVILGLGEGRETYLGLARELGVDDSVTIPPTSVPLPVVRQADVFCLSSRWEGLPLTLMEALVLGTPCVATDCVSGPRAILADGEYGDLVPVDDEDALADALARHLDEPQRLRDAARRGSVWAAHRFDFGRGSRELLTALEELVRRGRR